MICSVCNQKLINDEVALSIKIIGMSGLSVFCYGCLAKKVNIKIETLREIAEYHKRNGCSIFQRKYIFEGEDSL